MYREFVTDWQRQLVFDVVRKQPDEKPDETQTTPSNSTGIQDLTEEPDKPSPGITTFVSFLVQPYKWQLHKIDPWFFNSDCEWVTEDWIFAVHVPRISCERLNIKFCLY